MQFCAGLICACAVVKFSICFGNTALLNLLVSPEKYFLSLLISVLFVSEVELACSMLCTRSGMRGDLLGYTGSGWATSFSACTRVEVKCCSAAERGGFAPWGGGLWTTL